MFVIPQQHRELPAANTNVVCQLKSRRHPGIHETLPASFCWQTWFFLRKVKCQQCIQVCAVKLFSSRNFFPSSVAIAMTPLTYSCHRCASTAIIDTTQCRCGGHCNPEENLWWSGGWLRWKSKLYCRNCLTTSGWQGRSAEKAAREFSDFDQNCREVIDTATFSRKRTLPMHTALHPSSNSLNSTPSTTPPCLTPASSTTGLEEEVEALRTLVETLSSRIVSLEETLVRSLTVRVTALEDVIARSLSDRMSATWMAGLM